MDAEIPEQLNIADWFLDARVREGRGDRIALRTDDGELSYQDVQRLANRFANVLLEAGIEPEQRVIIALPDSAAWVGAFFGVLKMGAVAVMLNPSLKAEAIEYFFSYTRARAAVVHADGAPEFRRAATATSSVRDLFVLGDADCDARLDDASHDFETFPTHRDDAAIWLFSGGTTGQPKAVVQSHNSFVNTTLCYAHGVIGYRESDITVSVPKLFFGYATGSNLLFPFSVGASVALFEERCTAEALFARIAKHRPTILINVPTMINNMLGAADAGAHDLSCLRLSTSAGEALPAELQARWDAAFGVELLDGLGTAEQWHVFISNRPGDVTPGTLGKVVPGFEVRVCDVHGNDLPDGEIGYLWVRGNSRAIGYWQRMRSTMQAFRGEWYVSGDMIRRAPDATYVYCGRDDDMLKVSGKWLSPGEVENCLMGHPAVSEVAVVGVEVEGLVKPKAFVVATSDQQPDRHLAEELKEHVRRSLEPYKYPREVEFLQDFPRTHLGKIDRGALKRH